MTERPLRADERDLAAWMLRHGQPHAREFLSQLDRARVVSRCPCGCASIGFGVEGLPSPAGPLRILGDFIYGEGDELGGVFIFEQQGILSGLEVYALGGDTRTTLPAPEALRRFG